VVLLPLAFLIKRLESKPHKDSKKDEIDVTNQVLYINVATGVSFVYNEGYKNDPNFGYGNKAPGWVPLAGVVTRLQNKKFYNRPIWAYYIFILHINET